MEYVPPINGDEEDPDRPYIDANPALGIEGSRPPAASIEHTQREIVNAIAAAGLVPDKNDLTQLAQVLAMLRVSLTPIGVELDWPFDTPPDGWYEEDGSLLVRADVPQLWAKVDASGLAVSEAAWSGGEFGKFSTGDGATTFRLPDVRGYSSRAWDHGRGVDSGRTLGSVQADQLKQHEHRVTMVGVNAFDGTGGSKFVGADTGLSYEEANANMEMEQVGGTEVRVKNIARMRIIFGGA